MMRPIDFHLHFGPDDRPRKYEAARIVADYARVGARGILYKSHQLSTSIGASILESTQRDVRVAGGVALNRGVGGLNPAAVEASARSGGRVVWMPTHDVAAILAETAHDGIDGLVRRVRPVLELCAQHELVLCSGHLPPAETLAVFASARSLGVERRVVNHPDHVEVAVPTEVQAELAAGGTYLERVIPRAKNTSITISEMVDQMRAVGVERNVLGSDLGQIDSEDPADGFMRFLEDLAAAGIADDELAVVGEQNAAALLGWEASA